MGDSIPLPMLVLLRVPVAAFCGACIDYGWESRLKTAGIRTLINAVFAFALLMNVSKYG